MSTSIPTSWHCTWSAAAGIFRATVGEIMLQLQSAFGIVALLAIAWAFGENRRAVSPRQAAIGLVVTLLTAVILIKLPVVAHAFGTINDAVGAIAAASRAGSVLCVRLCRRRPAAVRPQGARRGFHPGVPGAADRAGHERADDAAVLLARAAADRARHGLAAGAHARRRRRGRACPPPPTSSSAWWKRRCSCGRIWRR